MDILLTAGTHLDSGGELLGHEERLVARPPGVARVNVGEGPRHAVGGEAGVITLWPRVGVVASTTLNIIHDLEFRI